MNIIVTIINRDQKQCINHLIVIKQTILYLVCVALLGHAFLRHECINAEIGHSHRQVAKYFATNLDAGKYVMCDRYPNILNQSYTFFIRKRGKLI